MAARVACEKGDLLPFQRSDHDGVGWIAERSLDADFAGVGEALHGVKATAADDADGGVGLGRRSFFSLFSHSYGTDRKQKKKTTNKRRALKPRHYKNVPRRHRGACVIHRWTSAPSSSSETAVNGSFFRCATSAAMRSSRFSPSAPWRTRSSKRDSSKPSKRFFQCS